MDIAELKRKSLSELQDMAEGLNIPDTAVAGKPELIFRIEQNLLDSDVALHDARELRPVAPERKWREDAAHRPPFVDAS